MKRNLPSTSAIIPAAQMLLPTYWATSKRSLSQPQFAKIMHRRARIERDWSKVQVDAQNLSGTPPHTCDSRLIHGPDDGCFACRHYTLVFVASYCMAMVLVSSFLSAVTSLVFSSLAAYKSR
jgi:hypothetical protein